MANATAAITGSTSGTTIEDGTLLASGILSVSDADPGQSFLQTVGHTLSKYGQWWVDANGTWSYLLNNVNPSVQALAAGSTLSDSFVVTSLDGSASKTVSITIQGTNDIPVITGKVTGAVTEDKAYQTFGTVVVTDIEAAQSGTKANWNGVAAHGTWSVDGKGNWNYKLNNADVAVQALGAGETLTDSFAVQSIDGSASQVITITINGTNDVPTITGQATGNVVADGVLIASGSLVVTDKDNGQSHSQAATGAGKYGSWSVDADGHWSYQLDNANGSVQALAIGKTLTDSFTVNSQDGGGHKTVTVTITGSNHLATIAGQVTGTVTESTALKATGTLTVTDVDSGEAHTKPATNVAATYGHWSVDGDGHWSYQLDQFNPTVMALAIGQKLSDSFTVQSLDGSASKLVTVTIAGNNHVPVITGSFTGSINEGTITTASGNLVVTDSDAGQSHSQAASGNAQFGTWTVDGDGHWSYQLDSARAPVLASGQTATDSFTVLSLDGTASQVVTLTIAAAGHAATISGSSVGAVAEDGTLTANGTLTVVDADAGQAHSQTASNLATTYGHWAVDADGHWSYQLDNTNTTVQALGAGQTLTDTFTVTSQDGSASKQVSITITGTNDVATINGQTTGAVTEDGTLTATGTLTVSDADAGQAHSQTASNLATTYGHWSVDADGHWSYQLDNTNTTVQALSAGQTLTDSFTVTSQDGSALKQVSITISGTNDVATINGQATGAVTEDGTLTATGTLTVNDVDNGQAHTQVATNLATTYGQWSVDANGAWSYKLNNGNATVQALSAGQTLTDSFTVASQDGSAAKQVSITITGSNDLAAITGQTTGAVTEDGTLTATGTLTVNDADTGQAHSQTATNLATTYGHWSVDADGHWNYQLDNTNTKVQALGAGQTLTDSFTVASQDGSASKQVSITITGSNDIPVANAGTASGAEDSVLSGKLVASDVDKSDSLTYSLATGGAPAHGSVTINANGSYSYTPAANYNGSDSFTYQVSDGHGGTATAKISLTVTPVNDAPTTPTDGNAAANTVAVGAAAGTAVGITVTATDIDSASLSYSLTNNAGGKFQIDPTTGVVTVAAGAVLTAGTYTVSAVASDGQLQSAAKDFTITVAAPGNHAPTLTDPSHFVFTTTDANGVQQFWYSDANGQPVQIATPNGVPSNLTIVGDKVYCIFSPGNGYGISIFDPVSQQFVAAPSADATPVPFGSVPFGAQSLIELSGKLYFSAADQSGYFEVWSYDPSAGAYSQVTHIAGSNGSASPSFLTSADGKLYFGANDGTHGVELWSYDPATGKSVMTSDILTSGSSSSMPQYITAVDGKIYFSADDGSHGVELWMYDPATASAALVKDIAAGFSSSSPHYLTNLAGKLYFAANDAVHGRELWVYDPSTKTASMAQDLAPGFAEANPQFLTALAGKLYFFGADASGLTKLWFYDPAISQVSLAADIFPGGNANPQFMSIVDGKLMFSANDGIHGIELWSYDPATNSANLFADLNPAINMRMWSSGVELNGKLYFAGSDAVHGTELWAYDPVTNSSSLVSNINPISDSQPHSLLALNGKLYFGADDGSHGAHIYVYDPTTNAVSLASNGTNTSMGFDVQSLTALGGKIYYSAFDATHGYELFAFDPVTKTSGIVADIAPGAVGSLPQYLTALNGKLYFSAENDASGQDLFSYDPVSRTKTSIDINPGAASSWVKNITALNGKLYFSASDGTHGSELWTFDPTTQKAVMISDLAAGAGGSGPENLTILGGQLYFTAASNGNNPQLWVLDPATQSITLAPNTPASFISGSAAFTVLSGKLYFTAGDGQHGNELWVYDPVAKLGHVIADIVPGSGSSDPAYLSIVAGKLVVSATDLHGQKQVVVYDPATGEVTPSDVIGGSPASSYPTNIFELPHATVHVPSISMNPNGNIGSSVSSLISGQVADSDVNAQLGIAIVAADSNHGTWQYSLDNGSSWRIISAVSEQSATLLAATALIRFVPSANWAGGADIKFHAWDQTDGHHSGDQAVDVRFNGGTSAYSYGVLDAQIQVTGSYIGTDNGETLNGSNGNDLLWGHGGDDIIHGNNGDDTIIGDKGNDTLDGGLGADTFVFNVGDGYDTIIAGGYDSADRILLTGSSFYDINFGWLNQDLYIAPALNANYNYADTGYVVLKNFLNGSTGHIAVQIDLGSENAFYGTDLSMSTFVFEQGLKAQYNADYTEVVIGTDSANTITGGGGFYDLLYGNGGNDTINGGAGRDFISGGDGDDVITGGKGDDILHGGAGADVFQFNVGDGYDTIIAGGYDSQDTIKLLGVNFYDINFDWSGKDLYVAQAINGNFDFADTGSVELRNFLDGSAGHINVQIDVGTYNLDYGTDAHLTTLTFQQGLTGTDNADHTEVLIGTSGNDVINGNGGYYDMIYGGAGNDTLNGGYGVDALHGGTGDDTLNGMGGNDVLTGNAGNDILNGGDGIDTASYHYAAGGIVADLSTNSVSNDGDGGHDTLSSIENIRGSLNDDHISGDGGNNFLSGLDGNDVIFGAGGNDTLAGGAGADTLTGGSGADQFKYYAASDSTLSHLDVISDFNAAEGDTINLGGLGLSGGISNGGLIGSFGAAPNTGFGGNGLIIETDGVNTRIYADTDHSGTFNAATDLAIQLTGNHLTELVTHPTAIIVT